MHNGIDQRVIKDLLVEASEETCAADRRTAIKDRFIAEALGRNSNGEDPGIDTVIRSLFEGTIKHRPHLLPSLFPFFALVCGERANNYGFTRINWSIIDFRSEEEAEEMQIGKFNKGFPENFDELTQDLPDGECVVISWNGKRVIAHAPTHEEALKLAEAKVYRMGPPLSSYKVNRTNKHLGGPAVVIRSDI